MERKQPQKAKQERVHLKQVGPPEKQSASYRAGSSFHPYSSRSIEES